MSAQSKHDRNRDRVLEYAPPWMRVTRNADDAPPIQPTERIRSAPQPDEEAGYDEQPFSGDVAIRQLRRRRSLEPEPVPEPSVQRAAPLRGGMVVRLALVALVVVVAVALVAMMSSNGVGGLWARFTGGDSAASRASAPAPITNVELANAASPPAVAPNDSLASPPAVAAAAVPSPVPAAADVPVQAQAATPAAVSEPAPVPSMPPVRGVTETAIKFGMSAPFSGPARELGRQMKLGIETAFDRVNDAGGISGRQLHLVTADDGYEPGRTGEAMKHLYDADQVFGIIGNVGTPTAAVAAPFALDRKMLFFGAFTGANLLRHDPPDRYVFNYRASYAEETSAVVRYLVKVRGLKPEQIAVFAQQDSYGDSGFEGVAKAIRQLPNGDGVSVLRLNYQRNTIDVDDAVKQLRAHKGIKAVVMVATYRAAAKFIEKTRPFNPALIYTNVSFVGSTELADELMLLGPKYANGVIVTQVVPAVAGHSTTILEYKSALQKYFPGEAPSYVSLEGYVTGNVLIEGLKRAGPQVDTEHLVDALESLHKVDLGLGTPITFSRDEHQASHKVWGTQLDAKGHYQELDLE
jgi:branched-chain amino acid transport system substrate-binding protein